MVGLARGPAAPQFNVAHAMTNEINLAHTKINEIQQRNNLSRHRPPCNHRFRFSRDSFHIPVPLTSLALAVCGGDLFQVAHDTMQDLRCTWQPRFCFGGCCPLVPFRCPLVLFKGTFVHPRHATRLFALCCLSCLLVDLPSCQPAALPECYFVARPCLPH